jgi:nucleotide-binding universal stress UspA family protein
VNPARRDPAGSIVVGVDGSPCSERALEWAAALAAELGAEVVAVHALGLLVHVGATTAPAQEHRAEVRARLEGPWTASLRAAGVAHRCVLVDGNPVTALLAAAGEHGGCMVVVGSRGTGGFPGLQLGSTSHQLAQYASLPVVIVPSPVS